MTYTYDANGNQTGKTAAGVSTRYVFDVRDELISVVRGTSTLGVYGYDARDLRVTKQGSGGLVEYVYDDKSVLLQADATGATVAKYDYGPDRLLSINPMSQSRQFYLSTRCVR